MAGDGDKLPRGIQWIGDKYRVRVTYQGSQYQIGVYYSLGDARAALDIARSQIARELFVPVPVRRRRRREAKAATRAEAVTVRVWADQWLDALERVGRSPGTIATYRSTLKTHVLPMVGDKRLRDVTPAMVDRITAGKPAPTVYNITRTMSSMFRAAMKAHVGGVQESPIPSGGVDGKATRTDDADDATIKQVQALANLMPDDLAPAVWLAATCGLRLGEVLGLQRRDLHLDDEAGPTVTVARQWLMKATPPAYGEPKAGSARTVAIPASVVPALHAHLARFVAPEPEAVVFPSHVNPRKPVAQTTFDNQWRAARDQVKPGLHFHSLRHVALTLYAEAGATSKELLRRGGHSSLEVAMRYQGATKRRDVVLTDRLDAAIIEGLKE